MRRPGPHIALAAIVALVLGGCGSGAPATPEVDTGRSPAANAVLDERLDALDDAVSRWEAAADLGTARAAAETARNLVVGSAGPDYGDADGDGTIGGATDIGLLPGLGGEPGAATEADGDCVVRDVLGGDWSDPADRWAILAAAIDAWRPTNNTFPSLPSHPQRVVGWATLALAADDLDTALEYAGHARLHVDISTRAAADCP